MRSAAVEAKEQAEYLDQKSIDSLRRKKPSAGYLAIKRLADIVCASVALVCLSIPMLLVALCIVLDSRGPAIYTQERIGKNNVPFRIYKFRTMYQNADKMLSSLTPEQQKEWKENFKLTNDPRITRVGKLLRRSSMDELPQLLNILKGELSLVGPRPVLEEEAARYGANRALFLSVTPGLTGYWQAYARNTCTYKQRMEMELFYVQHAGIRWDIRILFATVGRVLSGQGAR